MAGRVIVTRARPGADRTARRLTAEGFEPVVVPALELTALPPPDPASLAGAAAAIFTSANGVRWAPVHLRASVRATFCVGNATADAARAAGWPGVASASGDADALVCCVLDRWTPADGLILHLANAEPRGRIAERLSEKGYAVRHVPTYESRPSAGFEAGFRDACDGAAAILIHSPAAAHVVAPILARCAEIPALTVAAISPPAAAPFAGIAGVDLRTADSPDETALIRLLRTA